MAGHAINTIIGLVSGGLGILQFGMDNFAAPETAHSVVRVTVGLDYDGGLSNSGGDLPDVRLFNEAGDFIGMKVDPGKVQSGSFGEIKVDHDGDNGQQATYTLLSANNDAICIAHVTITWPDGDKYAWVGDWGDRCGATWYYSNVYVGGTSHKPRCMWIDLDGDQPQTGFQIHWPEFVTDTPEAPSDLDQNYLCNAGPPFRHYSGFDPRSITYWVLGNNKKRSTRTRISEVAGEEDVKKRSNDHNNNPEHKFNDALIINNSLEQSASALCGSHTSVGPDYANMEEGLFCRMSDKTLFPICDQHRGIHDNCFDSTLQQLIVNGKAARDSPYKKVTNWGDEKN